MFVWLKCGKKGGEDGAGEGNRTPVISLEGWSFTTKLRPLRWFHYYAITRFLSTRRREEKVGWGGE